MGLISQHFTLEELVHSQTAERDGIDNTPTPGIIANLTTLAQRLDDIRDRVLNGKPMIISSGYRCPELNKKVGGAPDSDHMRGLAADFICPQFGTPADIARAIAATAASDLEFDQVIYEYTWCHFGVGSQLRRQALTMNKQTGHIVAGIVTAVV